MKVTFISDTHTKHYDMYTLPAGDVLIFSGDAMSNGYRQHELEDFLDWFKSQPYKYKIYVAGNHDRFIENKPTESDAMFAKYYNDGVRFLCNEMIDVDGLKIYGTPYQPFFCDWAFNVPNSYNLYNIYKQIPENLDILVTHCPPYDILDKSHRPRPYYGMTGEEPLGSKELLQVLNELVDKAPKYHSFGHIHGDGGNIRNGEFTKFINASVCDESYDAVNGIISLEIEPRGDK